MTLQKSPHDIPFSPTQSDVVAAPSSLSNAPNICIPVSLPGSPSRNPASIGTAITTPRPVHSDSSISVPIDVVVEGEWSSGTTRAPGHGLNTTAAVPNLPTRENPPASQTYNLPSLGSRAGPFPDPKAAPTRSKRPPDEDPADCASSKLARKKRKHKPRLAPPRNLDLSAFKDKGPLMPAPTEPGSPLFFSNKQKLKTAMIRPPGYTGSETAGTILRSVKDATEITTLRLARGTVNAAASPARSSSTPGSWSSFETAAQLVRSPDSQAHQLLQTVGIFEFLENDTRPTFVLSDTPDSSYQIIYQNPALILSSNVRHMISGDFPDQSGSKADFNAFKAWTRQIGSPAEGNALLAPSFSYEGIEWSGVVMKGRFRVISANKSAAAVATPASEAKLEVVETGTSTEYRSRAGSPDILPTTPVDMDMSEIPEPPMAMSELGYFGQMKDVGRPSSVPSSEAGDSALVGQQTDFSSEMLPYALCSQSSFDWTRIPLSPDLPEHIKFARTRDWASTPLGPIGDWSADLRAMANMVMGSPHPAALYWGPEYIVIYNEAYVPLAGRKHPKLMGQSYKEAWKEIWTGIAPFFDSAWQSGQATMKGDDRLLMDRYGFEEETFFSWSIVPLVGEDGSVVGLYNPCFENTRRKVAERRMLTLRELGERTSLARDVKSFWSQVQQGLEYNEEDTPFVMVYSVSEDSGSDHSSNHSNTTPHPPQLVLEASLGIPKGHSCTKSPLNLMSGTEWFAPYLRDSMEAGAPIVLSKDDGTLAPHLMDGFELRGQVNECRSVVIFPLHPTTGGEGVVGFIVVGVNPRRPYDEDYRLFIHLLSRQLATSMASVVLFEEEIRRGQRAARLAALDRQELTKQLHLRTQEVAESELKFTRMAEFAPVGIFIADYQGVINYCNGMWWDISQHSKGCSDVNLWMNSVKNEDRPALETVWSRLINEKLAVTHEFRFKSSREMDGSVMENWVLMSAYPERDGAGAIKSIFGCITNISQQKLAEQIQKHRREEAVELKRQQENFIDITSHEMRNPLSAVLQCADEIAGALAKFRVTEDYNKDADCLRTALESCLEAANTITLCASHQKRIVDDILTLSKLDSQLLLVTPVNVQPVTVVQRALKMFEGELNTNGISLQFIIKNRFLELGVDWVKLDPSRLLQVLINLITNAIKFTHSRPERKILVTLDAAVEFVEGEDTIAYFPSDGTKTNLTDHADWGSGEKLNLHFSVEDTGRGLDEHEKTLLFQRFSQTTPRTHVQYGGSGLGLFISRILTELQGGQIGVLSKKGVGSTFSFYVRCRKTVGPKDLKMVATTLPLNRAPGLSPIVPRLAPKENNLVLPALPIQNKQGNDSEVPVKPVQKAMPAKSTTAKKGRFFDILIVEDNLVNQKVLRRQLQNVGNQTQVANHGGEALEVIKRSRFWRGQEQSGANISVILMDLEMPVMDGMTCARRIRELEREGTITSHIPIIAVTAYARPEQIHDAKGVGIDDVISKPFRIPELLPRVQELLDRFPACRDFEPTRAHNISPFHYEEHN